MGLSGEGSEGAVSGYGMGSEATGPRYHFVVKLVDPGRRGPGGGPSETVASVFAADMSEAIARAMARYPGQLAVHGERH